MAQTMFAGFQFLIGKINPRRGELHETIESWFQFLIGKINPQGLAGHSVAVRVFQFLIGKINPTLYLDRPHHPYLRFNSS